MKYIVLLVVLLSGCLTEEQMEWRQRCFNNICIEFKDGLCFAVRRNGIGDVEGIVQVDCAKVHTEVKPRIHFQNE